MSGLITKFKNKIEKFKEKERQERIESRTIYKDNLKLYFDDKNRVRLYYKDTELTKYFGFSAGILSDTVWYDSCDSESKVKKISSGQLQIILNLHSLPLSQIWNIEITDEGNIIWEVNIELKCPLRIDARNAKIFLSKLYSQWINPLTQGEFPIKFDSHWHLIDLLDEPG